MKAARLAGLPLLEQVDYVMSILRLPANSREVEKLMDKRLQEKPPEFRLLWKGKDPSPQDKTLEIQDWEFNKRRGGAFSVDLHDFEKEELKRRQIYYQLYGGVLGSGKEILPDTDIIIVDLNLIFQKENYNAATAQKEFGKYVDDAVRAYGQLQIKFNINSWTAGDAKFVFGDDGSLNARITEGFKSGFYNVIFGKRNNAMDRLAVTTIDVAQNAPVASFIYENGLGGGGILVNRGLRTHSLAHELGHAFGLLGSEKISDPIERNKDADWDVDKAIVRLSGGNVKKGIDWGRSGLIIPDASGNITYLTVFDILRAGARALARKI